MTLAIYGAEQVEARRASLTRFVDDCLATITTMDKLVDALVERARQLYVDMVISYDIKQPTVEATVACPLHVGNLSVDAWGALSDEAQEAARDSLEQVVARNIRAAYDDDGELHVRVDVILRSGKPRIEVTISVTGPDVTI
jgi:hypothetical protein